MQITLDIWRGVGIPDNRDGQPQGVWHTMTFPMERLASAERAFATFIRQGMHVVMVKPHRI